ncbi:MAG: PQQ-binding-like beta-propeller repeat protein, partial [Candidatus Latescibacteria bacterium]|nr:PQQ-binding-like beta-propeller repeat protein [Candidatus Latescibacterota bacterium]
LLVDGDTVFCTPGGPDATVVALNRHTGKVLWQSKTNGQTSTYCSPGLITHNGRRLLVTMTGRSAIGLDRDTGEFLWERKHITKYDINPNTPLYHDGHLYIVSGYGTGGQMLKLNADGTGVEQVWAQSTLDSQMGSAVLIDGYLYGSGQKNRGWHCVSWETGEVTHTAKALGNKGNIIYADGMAYCYGEKGEVGLVKLSSDAFEVVSSFKVEKGSAQHWAHLVIRDGRLYVRHGEALMVYDIAAE